MNIIDLDVFSGLTDEEFNIMKSEGYLRSRSYRKNEPIMHMGDYTDELGIVLKGSANVENIDLWGNKSILNHISEGHILGETYAITGEILMVDIIAAEASEILFLNARKLIDTCNCDICNTSTCSRHGFIDAWHSKMLRNLLMASVHRNITLSSRVFYTSPKKIRNRLLSYLSGYSRRHGSSEFDIPFNRQQLADYLNLDRSALSKELALMQQDNLIEYNRNHFKLKFEESDF